MKQQVTAGGTLDVLTKGEMVEGLREWMVSLAQGARPITFSAQADITAAGTLRVGGEDRTGTTGPEPGFMWIVRRLALQGPDPATDPTSIYLTDNLANRLVFPGLTGATWSTGYKAFNAGEFVVSGDDKIIVASTAPLAATGTVTLTGAGLMFPHSLAWRYLS